MVLEQLDLAAQGVTHVQAGRHTPDMQLLGNHAEAA
jgi:hypothetical protein